MAQVSYESYVHWYKRFYAPPYRNLLTREQWEANRMANSATTSFSRG